MASKRSMEQDDAAAVAVVSGDDAAVARADDGAAVPAAKRVAECDAALPVPKTVHGVFARRAYDLTEQVDGEPRWLQPYEHGIGDLMEFDRGLVSALAVLNVVAQAEEALRRLSQPANSRDVDHRRVARAFAMLNLVFEDAAWTVPSVGRVALRDLQASVVAVLDVTGRAFFEEGFQLLTALYRHLSIALELTPELVHVLSSAMASYGASGSLPIARLVHALADGDAERTRVLYNVYGRWVRNQVERTHDEAQQRLLCVLLRFVRFGLCKFDGHLADSADVTSPFSRHRLDALLSGPVRAHFFEELSALLHSDKERAVLAVTHIVNVERCALVSVICEQTIQAPRYDPLVWQALCDIVLWDQIRDDKDRILCVLQQCEPLPMCLLDSLRLEGVHAAPLQDLALTELVAALVALGQLGQPLCPVQLLFAALVRMSYERPRCEDEDTWCTLLDRLREWLVAQGGTAAVEEAARSMPDLKRLRERWSHLVPRAHAISTEAGAAADLCSGRIGVAPRV